MNILIIGECGVGKTWVMKQLITPQDKRYKLGKINFHENNMIIVGKYDDSVFEGSDKLSMSAITDVDRLFKYAKGKTTVWEGDRFTNSTFIHKAKPIILRIKGNGEQGRVKRGSNQSERQIKSIRTRVNNIKATHEFNNSVECLNHIKTYYEKN